MIFLYLKNIIGRKTKTQFDFWINFDKVHGGSWMRNFHFLFFNARCVCVNGDRDVKFIGYMAAKTTIIWELVGSIIFEMKNKRNLWIRGLKFSCNNMNTKLDLWKLEVTWIIIYFPTRSYGNCWKLRKSENLAVKNSRETLLLFTKVNVVFFWYSRGWFRWISPGRRSNFRRVL